MDEQHINKEPSVFSNGTMDQEGINVFERP